MTRSPINTADPIVESLRALVRHSPELKEAAGLYEIILPLIRDADLQVAPVSIPPDQAHAKMTNGLPLLHDLELALDNAAIQKLTLRLASALEKANANNRLLYTRIRLAMEENRLHMSELLPYVTANDRAGFISALQNLQLEPVLLWALAENALKPAWRFWRRQLAFLGDISQWNRGFCFICGAGALLGELQENNSVKHLRCGQCGADWPFSRLQCLYCGNEDHHTLGYFYADSDQEKMRVEFCEQCQGYLKVIVSFAPTPADMLALSDLATLHLDYIAQERGYTRLPVQARQAVGQMEGFLKTHDQIP